MPLLGAHMSIAGGYDQAVRRAAAAGCDVVQLFTKNNTQWRAKPLSAGDCDAFRRALDETGLRHPIAHASYLINLASPDPALWEKSVDALVIELRRADALGLEQVVVHPGASVTAGVSDGLRRATRAVHLALRRTSKLRAGLLLEVTAGQGSSLGHRVEHLAEILDALGRPPRLGVCLDTCHLLAAGYAIDSRSGFRATIQSLEENIGLDRVRAIHLNDSKRPRGSRVDRHAHIGEGCLGPAPFRWFLRDARLRHIPMYRETPKGVCDGEDLDVVNLRTLRALCGRAAGENHRDKSPTPALTTKRRR